MNKETPINIVEQIKLIDIEKNIIEKGINASLSSFNFSKKNNIQTNQRLQYLQTLSFLRRFKNE